MSLGWLCIFVVACSAVGTLPLPVPQEGSAGLFDEGIFSRFKDGKKQCNFKRDLSLNFL